MNVSQKCQYALRAVFELALHDGSELLPVAAIAVAQAIPPRFLEQILAELRRAGIVSAKRGVGGGYVLEVAPSQLTVGTVMRLMDGSFAPVACMGHESDASCSLHGECPFLPMWSRARDAVAGVYDETTFQDLVNEHQARKAAVALNYCI
jgi:Rrf2 family protein